MNKVDTWKSILNCVVLVTVILGLGSEGCVQGGALVLVSPSVLALSAGETGTLTASSSSASDTAFTWSSADPGIATVTPDGVATGVSEGTVLVTAQGSMSLSTGSASVTVTAADAGGPELVGLDTEKALTLPFEVQVAYNDDTVFFQTSWEGDRGDTHDYYRFTNGTWQKEGGPRRDAQATLDEDGIRGSTSVNSTIYESRMTFMLDDPTGPNAVQGFSEYGCMLTCHDNSRAMPTWAQADGEVHKYLPDDVAGRLDLWHHRLGRANPIGLSDDQWVGQRINGEDDGKGGSRHGDAGTGPYKTTGLDVTPEYVFDPGTTPNGEYAFKFEDLMSSPMRYYVDGTAEFLGLNAPNPVGIPYADAVAMGYSPSEGDTVPRRLLRQTAGSRGDITADGTVFVPSENDPLFGQWTSNVQRVLNTGNDDDTALVDGDIYNVAFAVHLGKITVRDHYVSFAYSLSLNGGDAEIQAVEMPGSGREMLPDFSDTAAYPVTALNLFLPGITSDEFLVGGNVGLQYIDPDTGAAIDQNHAGANALLTQGLGCGDCHTVSDLDAFEPVNTGGFMAGSMESLVLGRGGVHTGTPIPSN
jgi:hypothetical protein